MTTLRVLAVGDVVGKPGRTVLKERLVSLKQERGVDFCVVNGENAAGGSGLTPDTAAEIFRAGADVITMGDHVWKKREILKVIRNDPPILRPENFPSDAPGSGFCVIQTDKGVSVAVILLLGRVFMAPADCPFHAADQALGRIAGRARVILVDMHAEATSEKVAMGYHLDGRASLVFGTHTHVQTADERILPKGTAYITDLGMTGPVHSVLGRRVDRVLKKFITGLPTPFDVAAGPVQLCGVLVDVDPGTGRARSIERIRIA